jgi:hypothetical protein
MMMAHASSHHKAVAKDMKFNQQVQAFDSFAGASAFLRCFCASV